MRFTDLIIRNRAKSPVLLFLRRGQYYLFNDQTKLSNIEELSNFALENYEKTLFKGPIPTEPGFGLILWKGMIHIFEQYSSYINKFLMKDQATGQVNYLVMAFAYGIPIFMFLTVIRKAMINGQREGQEDKKEDIQKKKN